MALPYKTLFLYSAKYHKGKTRTVESGRKAYYHRRSISRQVRIFNPVIVRKNLQVKCCKTGARLLQFQTHAKAKREFLL